VDLIRGSDPRLTTYAHTTRFNNGNSSYQCVRIIQFAICFAQVAGNRMDLHFSNEAMRDLNYLHISLNSENITRLRQRRQKVKKGRMGHHRCIMHHPATYGPGYAQNTGDRRLDLSSSLSVSHHSTMYTVHGTGDCNQDFKVSRCPCTSTSTLPTLWPGAHTKNRPQSLSDKHIYLRNDYCSVMPVSRIELAGWHRCYINHLEAHHCNFHTNCIHARRSEF